MTRVPGDQLHLLEVVAAEPGRIDDRERLADEVSTLFNGASRSASVSDEARAVVKNAECTSYITTRHGWIQRYRKAKTGWTQTSCNGVVTEPEVAG